MSKHLMSVFYCKSGRWYVILSVPLPAIMAVINVVNWGAANGIMAKSGKSMALYYDQTFSHTEICVLTDLSMFAVGFYVFGMEKIYLEQEKSSQYHSQIAVYKVLEEQWTHCYIRNENGQRRKMLNGNVTCRYRIFMLPKEQMKDFSNLLKVMKKYQEVML